MAFVFHDDGALFVGATGLLLLDEGIDDLHEVVGVLLELLQLHPEVVPSVRVSKMVLTAESLLLADFLGFDSLLLLSRGRSSSFLTVGFGKMDTIKPSSMNVRGIS
jgi:hypothetical protein